MNARRGPRSSASHHYYTAPAVAEIQIAECSWQGKKDDAYASISLVLRTGTVRDGVRMRVGEACAPNGGSTLMAVDGRCGPTIDSAVRH